MADDLDALLDCLDRLAGPGTSDSSVSSLRMPAPLRDALRIAVSMGMDANANDATNRALRDRLEAFARRQALEAHYRRHPDVRPSLVDVAVALAELDGDPLAGEPARLAQAAEEVVRVRPDADADDVLLWAASLRAHRTAPSDEMSDVPPAARRASV